MNGKDHRDIERVVGRTSLKAVVYARVSTDKQEEEGSSLDTQVENCLALAQANGIKIVEVFREVFTGSLYRERPLLTKLRQMARNREFDIIIINTFDRLSRNQTHQAVLWDEMEHLGIKIECVKEKFAETPEGQFMRSALGFVAEVERQKIMERTQAGKRKRFESGKLNPGGKPRYGYLWETEKKERYVVNEVEASVVQEIFTAFIEEQKTCHAIAFWLSTRGTPSPKGMETWNKGAVYRILTETSYIGKAFAMKYIGSADRPKSDWYELPNGLIPPIIDEATFYRAQEMLKVNKKDAARNNLLPEEGLLRSGFVRCGYCKRAMSMNRRIHKRKTKEPQREVTYRCVYKYSGNPRCQQHPVIDIRKIDDTVWHYVGEIIQDFTLVERAISLIRDKGGMAVHNTQSIEKSIKVAQVNQEQFVADLAQRDRDGKPKLKGRARQLVIDELDKIEEYLENLEEEKYKALEGLTEWKQIEEEVDLFLAWCLNSRETYPKATYIEKRRAIRMLGIVAYVYRSDDEQHDLFEIEVSIPDLRDIVLQRSINLSRTGRVQ